MKETLNIINQVNEFYNSAWDKLIIVGTVAFAIVGIIIPLLIQWYQKKSLKLSEETLQNYFLNEVEKLKDGFRKEMNELLKTEISKFEKKIEELQAASYASTFHLQAQTQLDKNDFTEAFGDYADAAHFYLKAGDHVNLQSVLEGINGLCLHKINKANLEELKVGRNINIDTLFRDVQKEDFKGAFAGIIKQIRVKIQKLE